MQFNPCAMLLSIVIGILLLTPATFSIYHQRPDRKHGYNAEQQLIELLETSDQKQVRSEQQLISRHDDAADSQWLPVFDTDRHGRLLRLHSRDDSGLSEDLQNQLVDEHNTLRRNEGASDMEMLKWNRKLAKLARAWTDKCSYKHGTPAFNTDDVGFNALGQNNWIGVVDTLDVKSVVQDFFSEKQYFDYNSLQCTPGHSCDRYKQLVWSSTTDVGCAVKVCDSVGGLSNAHFVVCYYGPAGNWLDEKPYLKGDQSCTKCARGQFYCNNGLCDSSCKGPSETCVCKASCQNCATQTSDCKCQCKDGSSGADCSQKCLDFDKRCGRQVAGWPSTMCHSSFPFVIRACPKMCGVCKPGDPCSRENLPFDISDEEY